VLSFAFLSIPIVIYIFNTVDSGLSHCAEL
jgi:hypothetical protein